MKFKIALDLDDVLAQFYPAMCKRFGVPVMQTNIWDPQGHASVVANNFHIIQHNKNFWLNLERLSSPEDITFPVDCYLTSSPPLMKQARQQWLSMHKFPQAPLIMTSNKAEVMRQRDIDVLIDDKPSTIQSVNSNSQLIGIQFVPPYMSELAEGADIVRHLSIVPEVLKKYK